MEIFDLHNDILTSAKNAKKIEKYLKNNTKNTIITALWTTFFEEQIIFSKIEEYQKLKEKYKNIRFSIEDFNFVSTSNFEKIINLKPLYVGLTWNKDNALAGGCESFNHLTKFGEHIISKLNENKIVIDTAHLNEKSFMEVVNLSNKVICSHTAFSGVFDHKRNLKDYQIKMIIERGGIIGLCLCADFLSPYKKATIEDYAKHIEYFLNKYGDDNLCIGTDFHGTKHLPKGITQYKDFRYLEELLIKKGYSTETITKIFHKNAQEFFNEV